MVDLHHFPIAGALTGESHQPSRHRGYLRTLGTCEIDALVDSGIAREGIGSLAEIRRYPAVLDRAAFRVDLLVQLPGENQVLEYAQLLLAARQLILQLVDHGGQIRYL